MPVSKRLFSQFSIRIRLALMVGLLLLVSFISVGGASIYQAREVVEQRMLEDELPNQLQRVALSIDRRIAEIFSAGRMLASNRFVADWLLQGEPDSGSQALQAQLQQISNEFGADVAFLISARKGSYYTDKGLFKRLSVADPRDRWFYGFLESEQSWEIAFDQDEISGEMKAFVNYRMTDGDQDLAVVGIGIDISEVVSLVTSERVGQRGHLLLVEPGGNIRVQSDRIQKDDGPGKSKALAARAGQGDDVSPLLAGRPFASLSYQRQGQSYLMASTPVPSLGWYLVADLPEADIFARIDSAFIQVLQLVVGLSLLLLLPVLLISGRIATPIRRLAELMRDIGRGEGDLRQRLEMNRQDEIGQLADGFNSFVAKIQRSIREVDQLSLETERILQELRKGADSSRSDSQEQQQQLLMMASAIEEMRATIEDITQSASDASATSAQVRQQAGEGLELVEQAGTRIRHLSGSIEHAADVVSQLNGRVLAIGDLLSVIREVSDQTSLLALNAAIEAARAGDQGRGFAVVADEVRTLAQRSNQLTDDIQQHIGSLRTGSEEAMSAMTSARSSSDSSVSMTSRAGEAFAAIERQITCLSDQNDQVAEALRQQTAVVESLSQNSMVISDTGQRTLAAAGQVDEASTSLHDVVTRLRGNMGQFRY